MSGATFAYDDNEDGRFDDLLTPGYYHGGQGDPFREEVNTFVHHARLERMHHPFEDPTGVRPSYSTPANGEFGAGKGPGGTGQHHAAIDLHLDGGATEMPMYAAHDGVATTFRDADKYRHYLAITKSVLGEQGELLGTMVTLYAHIDLDLDEADSLFMDGQPVTKGMLVSRHLYSGTVGGPHLHFEVRYYRPADAGTETYYGLGGAGLTEPSAGPWSYGRWNPGIGYGFADPRNHGLFIPAAVEGLSHSKLDQTRQLLTWDQAANGVDHYNVYRGMINSLAEGNYDHLPVPEGCAVTLNEIQIDDLDDGESSYYLVAASNSYGEGDLGEGPKGTRRPPSGTPCN